MEEIIKKAIRKVITEAYYKKVIGEGLIKTHNPKHVTDRLNRFGNKRLKCYFFRDLEELNLGFINIEFFDKDESFVNDVIKYMDNMGYFFSSWVDIYNDVIKKPSTLTDYNEIYQLKFEPKFDIEYNTDNRYLYHVTDKKHLNKILKIGLTPKTKSKISEHPDRIYLAINLESAHDISYQMNIAGFINTEDQVLLKIDTQENPLFLMVDGQFKGGVYTTYNIKPEDIEVIDL